MKNKKENPGHRFFIQHPGKNIEIIPYEITGIHLLARYLLARFLREKRITPSEEGKAAFVTEVLNQECNKNLSFEYSMVALSKFICSSFDVRKNKVKNVLNSRDTNHVEYGIRKELEASMALIKGN